MVLYVRACLAEDQKTHSDEGGDTRDEDCAKGCSLS